MANNYLNYHHYNSKQFEQFLIRGEGREQQTNEYDSGDVVYLLCCTSIVWIMLIGVALFYNGLARNKSSMSLFLLCFWSCAVVSIQWWLIGYSLCLSNKGGPFIGNIDNALLRNIGESPNASNAKVPAYLVGIWYGLFACIAPTVFLGSIATRARFIPQVVFMFFWTTLVFDFLVYWSWNKNGWSSRSGTLDFGGGTPIHISTGSTGLAYALMLGKRKDRQERPPHNMTHVLLGTGFIWMGWTAANSGSGFSPNMRAVSTYAVTNLAASFGGVTLGLIDYFCKSSEKKWSPLAFCCGVISGLVAVTPASGFISPSSAPIFGVAGSISFAIASRLKRFLPVDDAYDVFCTHTVGALTGNLLTGVFADKSIAALDGTKIKGGGFYDGHWYQVWIQAIDSAAGIGWSFFVSLVILCIINSIRGLEIRAKIEDEDFGLDQIELGYSMYEFVEEIRVEMETLKKKVEMLQSGHALNGVISVATPTLTPVEDTNVTEEDMASKSKELADINGNV